MIKIEDTLEIALKLKIETKRKKIKKLIKKNHITSDQIYNTLNFFLRKLKNLQKQLDDHFKLNKNPNNFILKVLNSDIEQTKYDIKKITELLDISVN